MKNALILTAVWLGILVTAYTIVFWDQGIDRPLPISVLEQQVQSAKPDYVHPDGLFSLQIPMGWRMQEVLEYVQLTDPNENITVWIIATEKMELDVTLVVAFSLLDVGEDFYMVSSVSLPPDAWSGDDVAMIYQSENEDEVVTVRARRPDEWTVMMAARGPAGAVEVLTENLGWIWSELAIPADELQLL